MEAEGCRRHWEDAVYKGIYMSLIDAVDWFAGHSERAKVIPNFWNDYPKAKNGTAGQVVKQLVNRLDAPDRKTLRRWTKYIAAKTRLDNWGVVAFQAGILAAAGMTRAKHMV